MDEKVLNPLTKRWIKVGSVVHKKLVRDGVIHASMRVKCEKPVDLECERKQEELEHGQEGESKSPSHIEEILNRRIDILYLVGEVGNVCYFNQLASDFELSEYTGEAINKLDMAMRELTDEEKNAFASLGVDVTSVGEDLINAFVKGITRISHNESSLNPASFLQSKLCFYLDNRDRVNLRSLDSRLKALIPNNSIILPSPTSNIVLKQKNSKETQTITKTQYLNESMYATLDTLDDWAELDDWRKIETHDHYCFDILFLIKYSTDQLNTCKNTNPYPAYPSNPFTRGIFSSRDLLKLRRSILRNQIKISRVLQDFLFMEELWTEDGAFSQTDAWKDIFIEEMEKNLRYARICTGIESRRELCISGYWVKVTQPYSRQELLIDNYLETLNHTYQRMIAKTKIERIPEHYYFKL